MRALCVLSLTVTFACAAGSSSTGTSPATSSMLDAQSCAPMVPAVAYSGASVYGGPDSTSGAIATLKEDTPVCASSSTSGFGFRRVKLANGRSGFVEESSLSN